MKQIYTIILLLVALSNVKAQQFEWVKTFKNTGTTANNFSTLNELSNIFSLNENIIVTGKTNGKQIDLDPNIGQNLFYPSGYKNSDVYFTLINKDGITITSTMIYTPNGGGDNVTSLCYNKAQNRLKFGLNTDSDSIKFGNAGVWNKKSENTKYLVNYDTLLNFKNTIPFYSNKSCSFNDIVNDKNGNTYITGFFSDSLIINNKLRIYSKTSSCFFLKMDNLDSILWISHSSSMNIVGNGFEGKKLLHYSITENTINLVYTLSKKNKGVIYYPSDSAVFASDNINHQYLLSKISLNNGKIMQYNTMKSNNVGIRISEIKGNDSIIIIGLYGGNCNLEVGNDNLLLKYNKYSNEIPVISIFETRTLKNKFTNVFDSCDNYFSISNIFNDSLYYVFGASIGNQAFDFKSAQIKSSDFLSKTRIENAPTDFFAQYSADNNLRYVWQLPPVNKAIAEGMYSSVKILNNNGNIYFSGNFNYAQELALVTRSYQYLTGSGSDISLLKYNCKPTAYFNFSANGKIVNFKNLSSNTNSYLWEYGVSSATATTKNSSYTFPTQGATYSPRLIVTNDCGKDTFQQNVTIANINISAIYLRGFSISPNPSNTFVKIVLDEGIYILNSNQLEVSDISGKQINNGIIMLNPSEYQFDVSVLSSGLYTISILTNEGKFTSKIIVN